MFPKVDISDFNVRLTKRQQEMYDEVCKNYSRYKNFLSSLQEKEEEKITFNYGIYFEILDSKFDNQIIFFLHDQNEYIVYIEEKTRRNKNYKFVEEMVSYLIHYGKNVFLSDKYDYILQILYNPCVIPYETYLSLDKEKIKDLIDNIDFSSSTYIRNAIEEYIHLICPEENKGEVMEEDKKYFPLFMEEFLPDIGLVLENADMSMFEIGVEDNVLYIRSAIVDGKKLDIFYSNEGLTYFYTHNGERDERGEKLIEMIWGKIFRLYFFSE
jgi:hypothetical protein